MTDNISKSKRIINNTIALYIRMAFTMLISLYTSRVVLKELGIDDFGLYNVVGGVVAVFSFLKTSMSSSTQRFLSYEMGKHNYSSLKNTFSICLIAHVILAFILIIGTETIGMWFINNKLNIPEGRMFAAKCLFQLSVFSLFINIISIPYTADIISNEKMGYFAFLGIFDAILKLVIAFLITISPIDKLIFYSALVSLVTLINALCTWIFCYIKFPESHFTLYWNAQSFKKVFSFSGWTIWGQFAVVGSNQGTGILVNMFFNVAANAAIGVGQQVNNALSGLVYNFQSAFKPQITKTYAEGDYDYLSKLIKMSSKISFFLLFLVSLPILLNIEFVLDIWLDTVPVNAGKLCVIYIAATLCDAISGPLWISIFATGRIKKYQIALSFFYIGELLVIYALFKCGLPFVVGISMKALLNFSIIFVRLLFAKKEVDAFDISDFIHAVLLPIGLIVVSSICLSIVLFHFASTILVKFLLTCVVELFAIFASYYWGLSNLEKKSIKGVLSSKIKK